MQHDGQKANDETPAPAPALTDQAIVKIKDLILIGEFQAGSKLPRERDLAQKLGPSRNSLREAVRALALIGVLDTRVGDGTYVTSLDADLLMTGMGFVGELLDSKTLLEAHQVRRILEPFATGLAATRLSEADFAELADILERMEQADRTQAFIDADNDFHRVINSAAGNATLASLIHNLAGGMMRARLWRTATEHDAVDNTRRRHRDIYLALRAGDAGRASAADLIHLAENERWLEMMLASGELNRPHAARDVRLRKPLQAGDQRESRLLPRIRTIHGRARSGRPACRRRGSPRRRLLRAVRNRPAHRARIHGSPRATAAGHRARNGRDGRRGRNRCRGPAPG